MARRVIGLLVCVLIVVTAPARVEAQGIKGLIKKKVSSEVKGEEKSSSQQQEEFKGGKLPNGAIEITAPVGEALMVAAKQELRLRNEFKKQLASYKTPEQYQACTQQVAMTPEGQKIVLQFADLGEKATQEDVQRVTEKMNRELKALLEKQCGDDINEVWPLNKRNERIEQIIHEAATTFAAERAAGAKRNGGGPYVDEAEHYSFDDDGDYGLAKERVVAFCTALAEKRVKVEPGKPVQIPGSGRGVYWVFTAEEAEYLVKNCDVLMAILSELM